MAARASKLTSHEVLLREWVNRLGLQDWHIVLNTNCRPENMAMENAFGCTQWAESTKCATIDIIDEAFCQTNAIGRPFDFEATLVHELLHCKFSLATDLEETTQYRLMHQLVDDLSRALVEAKRYGKKD